MSFNIKSFYEQTEESLDSYIDSLVFNSSFSNILKNLYLILYKTNFINSTLDMKEGKIYNFLLSLTSKFEFNKTFLTVDLDLFYELYFNIKTNYENEELENLVINIINIIKDSESIDLIDLYLNFNIEKREDVLRLFLNKDINYNFVKIVQDLYNSNNLTNYVKFETKTGPINPNFPVTEWSEIFEDKV